MIYTLQDLVVLAVAIPGLPSALGAVAVLLWGAGEVRGLLWTLTQLKHDSSQLSLQDGAPLQPHQLLHAPAAHPELSAEVLPDGRLILDPGVWHWNCSLA